MWIMKGEQNVHQPMGASWMHANHEGIGIIQFTQRLGNANHEGIGIIRSPCELKIGEKLSPCELSKPWFEGSNILIVSRCARFL